MYSMNSDTWRKSHQPAHIWIKKILFIFVHWKVKPLRSFCSNCWAYHSIPKKNPVYNTNIYYSSILNYKLLNMNLLHGNLVHNNKAHQHGSHLFFTFLCIESAVTNLILPPWSAKLMMNFFVCSVFPVNMLDLICTWSRMAWKHWPEVGPMILAHWLASRSDLFDQNLTQPARTQLHLGWFYTIRSGPSVLWKNATESENGKLVAGWWHSARNRAQWFLHTSLLPDKMPWPNTWPGHPD